MQLGNSTHLNHASALSTLYSCRGQGEFPCGGTRFARVVALESETSTLELGNPAVTKPFRGPETGRSLALSQSTRLLPSQHLVPANSPFLAFHFLFLLTPSYRPGQVQVTSVLSVSTAQHTLARSYFPTDQKPRWTGHCCSALLCYLAVPCHCQERAGI